MNRPIPCPEWTETLDEYLMPLFPKADWTPALVRLWTDRLGYLDQARVRLAIGAHAAESRFNTPRIAAVLDHMRSDSESRAEYQREQEITDGYRERFSGPFDDAAVRAERDQTIAFLRDAETDEAVEAWNEGRGRFLGKCEGDDPATWPAVARDGLWMMLNGEL